MLILKAYVMFWLNVAAVLVALMAASAELRIVTGAVVFIGAPMLFKSIWRAASRKIQNDIAMRSIALARDLEATKER